VDADFFAEIGRLFSSPKTNPNKILTGLRLASRARREAEEKRTETARLRCAHALEIEKSNGLHQQILTLQDEIDRLKRRVDDLEQLVAANDASIADSRTQYKNLDHHWRETCQLQLAKQAHSIRSELSHEVQEARLSLDRPGPNVDMALDRIRRMEKALSKLGGAQ
jgi:chromosome segregation ATPase